MVTGRTLLYPLFTGVLLSLILSIPARALPLTQVVSADNVTIQLEHEGSNYYRFTTGEYNYRFLWDGGPTQLKLHRVLGYDANDNVIKSAPAETSKEGFPVPDAQLPFKGAGKARHASTEVFRIPAAFYLNRNIKHIAVDFSVVDGRMSIGPWLPMYSNWDDWSSVKLNLKLLIW